MAADSNFLSNLGVLGQTPVVPSKKGPVRPSQPDPNFMKNIGAFGSQSAQKPATPAPADQSFMQNLGAFSGSSRPEDPMQMMRREAGRRDVQRGLLDDGSFGFKDVYGRPLVGGKVQGVKEPERQILTPEETRTNNNDVVSTGKNLGGGVSAAFVPEYANSSFNDLLAAQGNQRYAAFSSNQLPTTGANPFEGTAPKTNGFNPAAPGVTGQSYDNYGAAGGVAAASSTDKSKFTPMSGSEERIEGASERPKFGRLDAALNDKAGINSYMSKFSSGDQERAANRAFLDTEKSMEALRAKEAVNGVVFAQNQHYIAGSDADGPAQKITRDEARDISNGRNTAAGLLESYKTRITESKGDTEPVEAQAPMTIEKPGVKASFSRTETITPGINTDIPGNVEFNSNNDDPLPAFDNTGGYKPITKKPAVDYSSIFQYK